ncbi:MAG: MarR family transcriptional regulator [Myxococcota bacterium]
MSNLFEIAEHLERVMRRIDAGLHERVPRIDTERVGPLGSIVLMRLAHIEPAPIQALVTQMGRDSSQMTRAIRSLETKGLVLRQTDPDDRRVRLLSLTAKGRAFVEQTRDIMSELVEEILEPLCARDQERLAALLEKLA